MIDLRRSTAQSEHFDEVSISILNPTTNELEVRFTLVSDPPDHGPLFTRPLYSVALGSAVRIRYAESPCSHFSGDVGVHALCYPLLIQREIVGILSSFDPR